MKNRTDLVQMLVLLVVSAIVYLPLINQIGYTHDDWYLMASARAEGAGVFREIYSVDRPLRAYVLMPAYILFGQNALPYNLSAWFFRTLSALFILWLLHRLWRGSSSWASLMALLYIIYPGFLSQNNGIDYLPQMVSLAAATCSLALTVFAFFEERRGHKIAVLVCAIFTGVIYLGLVEYEAGFELIRLALLFILVGRMTNDYRERILKTAKQWLPYSLIILVFGIWRVFFFQSERGATDVDVQFSQLWLHPLQVTFHWAVQVVQDFFDVTISAWVIPLTQLTGYIQRWGGVLALLTAAALVVVLNQFQRGDVSSEQDQPDFPREALWLGLSAIIGGLIPIAMVNRDIWFPSFSRYALVSSMGAAILIVALLTYLKSRVIQQVVIATLLLIAFLTHHANAIKDVQETAALRNFWWQVAWRVPQFEKNATLVAVYPAGSIEEDYFVWGPASLIYYPEKQNEKNIQPGVFAAIVNRDTVVNVLTRQRQQYDRRRNINTYANYRNIVILTQPTSAACVRVIDGARPENSHNDPDAIRVMSPYSEMEHVLADETPHAPPEVVFGPEPAHGWCFFYQKADLARQQGDWANVLEIGEEAFNQNLAPADPVEWMPFLQAYAHSNNIERLTELASQVNADPYISLQVCRILLSMDLSTEASETVNSLYCTEQN